MNEWVENIEEINLSIIIPVPVFRIVFFRSHTSPLGLSQGSNQ